MIAMSVREAPETPTGGQPRREIGVPTVSVIIPSLNAAPYIRAAIGSVLAQTHPVLEIIVADGGSNDGTQEIVAGYGEPVRLLDQRKAGRKGIAAGRNLGIEAASGEWLAFLDADDWWDARKTAEQLAAIEKCPGAALSYTGVCTVMEESGERQVHTPLSPGAIWPRLRWNNALGASTVLARRSAMIALGCFREDLIGFEDWEMWVRMRLHHSFACCPEPLSFYRILPHGISHNLQKHLDGIPQVCGSTMVAGLTGWRRWVVQRRLWAAQLYGAVVIAREYRAPQAMSLLWRSLAHWPFPAFLPIRYKALLIMLVRRGTG
jgi:glycosyltransferase involved in cell wall biosynthesis